MDYSLLVGVHFRDKRDKLATGGWLKIKTNLTILTWLLYTLQSALVEGSFDSDSSRASSPHLSRGVTDPNW